MKRRPLGDTGLSVSELGLGCAGFWARRAFDSSQAIDLVHQALDGGINFFDTGPSYANGEAERRLGTALSGRDRTDLVIATKVGTLVGRAGRLRKDFTPSVVRSSLEASLRRLRTDHVEVLLLHGPQAEDLTDDLLECLERLQTSGLVRASGVNTNDLSVVAGANPCGPLRTAMFDYNFLRSGRSSEIDRLAGGGIGVLVSTPLAQASYRSIVRWPRTRGDVWYAARAFGRHRGTLRHGRHYRFIDRVGGWTGASVAIAYVLRNPHVSTTVFGTTRPEHLAANIEAASRRLPDGIARRIDSTPDAPEP